MSGKKIVIDPEFGGAEPGGINGDGIRASDGNRKIAAAVAGLLRRCGGEVALARQEDHTVHATERVAVAENFGADVYIVVRTDSVRNIPYISFLPGSVPGQKIAEKLARQWRKASGDSVAVLEEHNFTMQHTRCPAVTLSLNSLHSPDPMNYSHFRKIAETVLGGVIDYFLDMPESQ